MPELPEVETVRRRLQPAMEGARFRRIILRRDGLRRPFPHNFAGRLARRTVRALRRRGKYLLAELSSGETLLMHLGMSGSMRVEDDIRATEPVADAATASGSPAAGCVCGDTPGWSPRPITSPLKTHTLIPITP